MGLGRLFNRQVESTEDKLRNAGQTFEMILDKAPFGSAMQFYRGAMSVPGAWRAANLISGLMAQLPWNAYRTNGGTEPSAPITPRPHLLERPNPQEVRFNTFKAWALDYLWHGNAIGLIAARDSDGYPTAVLPIPATYVYARRENYSDHSPLPNGPIVYQVGSLEFAQYDVIHFKGPHEPAAVRGMGVLESQLSTLELAKEQQKQAGDVAHHGVPTGVIRLMNQDAKQGQADEAKRKWMEGQRNRTVQVLNSAAEFQPISWSPDDMQMVEARKFTLHEIALMFGLPLSFLGADQSSRTYSNVEQDSIELLKFGVGEHFSVFEQTLSTFFPRGTEVRSDMAKLLRTDTLTRYQAYQIAANVGFLTTDEIREEENRPPLTLAQKAEMALQRPQTAPSGLAGNNAGQRPEGTGNGNTQGTGQEARPGTPGGR